MTDTNTEAPDGGWEPWMDNPFMTDQAEGTVLEDATHYQMQTRTAEGAWERLQNPRTDRDEVTRIQAYYLKRDKEDLGVRVLTRRVIWSVDEVPGHGEGQTPPEEIIARNEANTKKAAGTEQPEA